jgi:hypothetical protein
MVMTQVSTFPPMAVFLNHIDELDQPEDPQQPFDEPKPSIA